MLKKLPTKKELRDFFNFAKKTYGEDVHSIKRCVVENFEIHPENIDGFNKIFYKVLEEINKESFSKI